MRVLVRAALSATVLAVIAVTAPAVPAHAAGGGWVVQQDPSVQVDESFFMHKHVSGHPGNWHLLQVSVQQDDDGVMGGLEDFRCPKGEAPAPDRDDNCVQVGGSDFVDELGLTVTWSPRLRHVHVFGDIVLDDYVDDVQIPSTMNVHLDAHGAFRRTVTRSGPTDTDPQEYKRIDIQRGRVTARGHLGWLKATKAQVRNTQPLHVYWVLSRSTA